ncbi:hypothetical protein QBC32DRAFT_46857 [Pseudoneurospora amorphoporcata]|uniref:Uncharacterized protein n=1 Tax=Pseudoneurospora amorphoporcata TaxID=241081 RepID=A0AAN6SCT0_9PEZI|nr:hypothetical protein QBC32DRAFT_46857 [Pseudoneurospora amorphoporcata]
MSSEVFRRVGRGGAGNWYSKKDVEDAEKAAADLEAQKKSSGSGSPSPTTLERSITAQTSLGSSRAGGRGGAGNFYDASATDAAAAAQQEEEKEAELEELTRVVTASIQRPNLSGRLSGRGGAGNYSDNAARSAQHRMDPEQQRKMIEDLNARVLQDVEAGLAMPRPAYHAKFELKHERLVSAEP